jgi:hypothetical protein
MRNILIAASMIFASMGQVALAQNAPMVIGVTNTDQMVLRTGTKVVLKMEEEITTKGKKLRVGQRFRLQVAEPVKVNEVIVIPAGSPAIAEITSVRNKGMWGKSGAVTAQLVRVDVPGRSIRLSGSFDDKGTTGTAGVVGAIAFVPVAGFFMTGTSATIPAGATVTGFIDEDVPLQMAKPVERPVTVYQPAAGSNAERDGKRSKVFINGDGK